MPVKRPKAGEVIHTNQGVEILIKAGRGWKHFVIGKGELSSLLMLGNTVFLSQYVRVKPRNRVIEIRIPEGIYYFDGPDLRAILRGKSSRKSVPVYEVTQPSGGMPGC